jgi:REP element-mobilizing transposase RayT
MVLQTWEELPARFSVMELDAKVVMPNHFHAIVIIRRGEPCVRPERPESCIRPSDSPLPNVMQVNRDDLPEMGEHKVRPYRKRPWGTGVGSVGRIVQTFKSLTTHRYIQGIRECGWQLFKGKLWQRNYYERVIRDEEEWERISEYIAANPVNWAMDRENREGVKVKGDEPWQV